MSYTFPNRKIAIQRGKDSGCSSASPCTVDGHTAERGKDSGYAKILRSLREKAHAEIPQMPRAKRRVYAKVPLSNWPKVQKTPARIFADAKNQKFQRGTPCTTRAANGTFEPQANGQDVEWAGRPTSPVLPAFSPCSGRLQSIPQTFPYGLITLFCVPSAFAHPVSTLGGQISIFWCSVRISRTREILGWVLIISKKHAKYRY